VHKGIGNYFLFFLFGSLFIGISDGVRAIEHSKEKLVFSSPKYYLAERAINVRLKPNTKSARVGLLSKNQKIKSAGIVKGTKWLAFEKDDKIIGYVYSSLLVPIIDGSLKQSIKGRLNGNDSAKLVLPPCQYEIKFDKKNKVGEDTQTITDYFLGMICKYEKQILKIKATMFLTELPYLRNKKPIYQINIDLYDILIDGEDIFSVTVLYHVRKNTVVYHSVSREKLRATGKIVVQKAFDVASALKGALIMAHQSWGNRIWAELAKKNGLVEP
jgi:hypothetical protein